MWVHIDAAFIGSTWICEKYRPKEPLLELIDSICINFTKLLLNGTGGSLFYVGNKRIVNEAFGANTLQFSFYKNQYTNEDDVVDYKDWIVGLARRNNSIKLYYTFLHYGLHRIRQSVLSQEEKAVKLVEKIRGHPELFKIHTIQYSVVLFQVKDKHGEVSNDLTKSVAVNIKNIREGFCTPTDFRGTYVIRIVIGNFHTTDAHVEAYINRIIAEAKQQQSAF
jgi:aromatic-L-amino-acid/L-tryptophan decarboxylase